MLPFDYDYSKTPPIKFKHDAGSRKELKISKTAEELFDIIQSNDLFEGIQGAVLNNEINFKCVPIEGKVIGKPGKYRFKVKGSSQLPKAKALVKSSRQPIRKD